MAAGCWIDTGPIRVDRLIRVIRGPFMKITGVEARPSSSRATWRRRAGTAGSPAALDEAPGITAGQRITNALLDQIETGAHPGRDRRRARRPGEAQARSPRRSSARSSRRCSRRCSSGPIRWRTKALVANVRCHEGARPHYVVYAAHRGRRHRALGPARQGLGARVCDLLGGLFPERLAAAYISGLAGADDAARVAQAAE